MRRLPFLLAAASVAALCPLAAQNATPAPGRVPQWQCKLPGGSVCVAIRSLVSVSLHEYVVDGSARVNEAAIDTTGNALIRFYYLEPLTPKSPVGAGQSVINKLQELAGQAAERTGQEEPWKKVIKTFPGSTHAHTVEFRVAGREDLDKIVESASQAMREARDTTLTLK